MSVLMIDKWRWVWMFGVDVIFDKNECGCIVRKRYMIDANICY